MKLKFQRKKMQKLFQHQWSFFGFYFKDVLKIFGISIKKKNNMKVFFHHYLYHQYHLKQLHNGKLKSLQMWVELMEVKWVGTLKSTVCA